MKFTITDFRKTYPNDSACLDKIFQLRYGHLTHCPECGEVTKFRRISTRRSYQCRHCYFQLYPTVGTIFEKTTTPLSYWFYAIYLMTATRNGVSAKELERQLGVTYKTAFRMAHKIRELFAKTKTGTLKGFVELDESYSGGKHSGKRGRGSENKSIVIGIVERTGDVKAFHIKDTKQKTIYPIVKDNVEIGSHISTDEYPVYEKLKKLGYNHGVIKHKEDLYRDGIISTNTIEGYFSQLKRMINGTHIHVSNKYFQNYIDEASFRYNHRKSGMKMFEDSINSLQQNKN